MLNSLGKKDTVKWGDNKEKIIMLNKKIPIHILTGIPSSQAVTTMSIVAFY